MTDPVWSVNILLGIGLLGVIWAIYKVLVWDNQENVSLQSKEDQQSH